MRRLQNWAVEFCVCFFLVSLLGYAAPHCQASASWFEIASRGVVLALAVWWGRFRWDQ